MINTEDFLTARQKDVIGELFNMSLGSSTMAMYAMLERKVIITAPDVLVTETKDFHPLSGETMMAVDIQYIEGLHGRNLLILKNDDIRRMLEIMLMTEIDPDNFVIDEIGESAICELMNQMMGMASTSMARFLETPVDISTPETYEIRDEALFKEHYFRNDEILLIVAFDIIIENTLKSEFYNIMSLDFARELLELVDRVERKQQG